MSDGCEAAPPEPVPPQTEGADPPAPLPPPEPPPRPARALSHVTNGLDTTTASAADGAQARGGAPIANVRKRLGPTLDDWVVRKHVRK